MSHHITCYLATDCIASTRVASQPTTLLHSRCDKPHGIIHHINTTETQPATNKQRHHQTERLVQTKKSFFRFDHRLVRALLVVNLGITWCRFMKFILWLCFFVVVCQFLIPTALFQLFAGGENLQLRWRKIFGWRRICGGFHFFFGSRLLTSTLM